MSKSTKIIRLNFNIKQEEMQLIKMLNDDCEADKRSSNLILGKSISNETYHRYLHMMSYMHKNIRYPDLKSYDYIKYLSARPKLCQALKIKIYKDHVINQGALKLSKFTPITPDLFFSHSFLRTRANHMLVNEKRTTKRLNDMFHELYQLGMRLQKQRASKRNK